MITRALIAAVLSVLLSSCVLLLDDQTEVKGKPAGGGPSTSTVTAPPNGQVIYVCKGGRLVVTYAPSQATVFYDGANRVLSLTRTSPKYTYTDGIYTWEAAGREGNISVRGQLADTCSY